MYSTVVNEHMANPRNVGPLETATHHGVAGVPGDGPYIILWFEVASGRIERAAYQTYGCPAAIASASMAAELAIGCVVAEALALNVESITTALDGLPEGKEHCPRLAVEAISHALRGELK